VTAGTVEDEDYGILAAPDPPRHHPDLCAAITRTGAASSAHLNEGLPQTTPGMMTSSRHTHARIWQGRSDLSATPWNPQRCYDD